MTAYFDASALVKPYLVGELHRDVVVGLLGEGASATCRLSEVEVASALCRRTREGHLTAGDRDRVLAEVLRDMTRWVVLEITPALTAATSALLARHPLRSGDALHLAAAMRLRAGIGRDVRFVGFDIRLNEAARLEGFEVIDG